MSKRRPSGDGMVRKLKRGLWEGRIVIGHKDDGSSIFKYVYASTQKEISDKLRDLVEKYDNIELNEKCPTLADWLDKWLREYASLKLRPSTLEGYRRSVELHILPQLGGKLLTSATSADIQKLYNKLRKSLSGSSVRHIHNILHQALDVAVSERLIPTNPVDGAEPPKRDYAPKQILNAEQLQTLMEAIKLDDIWHDFFYTELTTGLRRGEICALRWEDFDDTDGKLKIQRTVKKEHGQFVFSDPKTFAGKRTIYLPESTAKVLRSRKATSISEWIFPNPLKPEEPTNPSSAYTRLKSILNRAGLPSIRFHDCRHTFSSHAIASGVDAKTLAGILGHTNASFTLDTYTHVTDDMKEKAAKVVGGFMEEIFGKELKPWEDAKRERA